MTLDSAIFEPPRFDGCPPICLKANLPAFPDGPAAQAFNRLNGSQDIIRKWLCAFCGSYHYWTKPSVPAGATSGTGRTYTVPPHVEQLIADSARMKLTGTKPLKQ
jgi:hypothetical protein